MDLIHGMSMPIYATNSLSAGIAWMYERYVERVVSQ